MEMLVLRNAGEIMARIPSEGSGAALADLSNAGKKENSKGFVEKASLMVLPLLALSEAHTPELDLLWRGEELRWHHSSRRWKWWPG
jgi:hypothetical protein